jgi:DNA transposition AAA+ family ATPase
LIKFAKEGLEKGRYEQMVEQVRKFLEQKGWKAVKKQKIICVLINSKTQL